MTNISDVAESFSGAVTDGVEAIYPWVATALGVMLGVAIVYLAYRLIKRAIGR